MLLQRLSFTNLSIRKKTLLLLISTILVTVALLAGISVWQVRRIVTEESCNSIRLVLEQVNSTIDNNIRQAEKSIHVFYYGSQLESQLLSSRNTPDLRNDFKKVIYAFKCADPYVIDLRAFLIKPGQSLDNTSIYNFLLLQNSGLFKNTLQTNQKVDYFWTSVGDSSWNKFGYYPTIYCYRPVYSAADNMLSAVIRVDYSAEKIFSIVQSTQFGDSGSLVVANQNGTLIYHDPTQTPAGGIRALIANVIAQKQKKGAILKNVNGQNIYQVFNNDNKLGWYVIGNISQTEVASKANELVGFLLVIAAIVCGLAIASAFVFSKSLTRRIVRLRDIISCFGKDTVPLEVNVKGQDEIGHLARSFELMAFRVNDLMAETEKYYQNEQKLIEESLQLQLVMRETELGALQSQINPHFLNNTLETIKGLAYANEPEQIIKVTQAMSSMLRYNLHQTYLVRLSEELKHLQDYILIQNTRFENKISLDLKLDETLRSSYILRFTIEPIVENAIIHGFRKQRHNCQIQLRIKCHEDKLEIEIADNGMGMSEQYVAELNRRLQSGESTVGHRHKGSIGLFNVNARIKRYYDWTSQMSVSSQIGVGTIVRLAIPFIQNLQDEVEKR
jgi:two-component system sensor histidine kinase YesM